jgi:hypothetical protein
MRAPFRVVGGNSPAKLPKDCGAMAKLGDNLTPAEVSSIEQNRNRAESCLRSDIKIYSKAIVFAAAKAAEPVHASSAKVLQLVAPNLPVAIVRGDMFCGWRRRSGEIHCAPTDSRQQCHYEMSGVGPSAVAVGIEVRNLLDGSAGCRPVAPARPTEWHDAARSYRARQIERSPRGSHAPQRQGDEGCAQPHGTRGE